MKKIFNGSVLSPFTFVLGLAEAPVKVGATMDTPTPVVLLSPATHTFLPKVVHTQGDN